MRTALAGVALIALTLTLALSCSGPEAPQPDVPPEPVPVIGVLPGVPQSKSLAGIDVEESTDGAWTLRVAANSRGDAEGRSWGGGSLSVGAPGARPGAPSAPGGAAPSPAESGAPATGGDYGGGEPEMDASADSLDDAHLEGGRTPENQGGVPLKAGATDDNEAYAEFLTFLATWGDRADTVDGYQMLDVADRRYIRVENRAGKPVPAATVSVVDVAKDRVAMRATTYGDGRVPFYPHLGEKPGAFAAAEDESLLVEVSFGGAREQVRWNGVADLTIAIDAPAPVADTVPLDILLLIDTTGSMGDEIGRIKASLLGMTKQLRSLEREFDLRYAAVLYRDVGDQYVTKAHPFTGDLEAFDAALQTIRAAGGGDGPESLNQGLAEAVGRADWRKGAAKVMFLVADAPPHMDYDGDVPYGVSLQAALAAGIRIHTVAASGLPPVGSLVFRQIAQFTRGKFIFIQYGSLEDTAASHGVGGKTKGNNLDDILFEQIREEVARWGRDG